MTHRYLSALLLTGLCLPCVLGACSRETEVNVPGSSNGGMDAGGDGGEASSMGGTDSGGGGRPASGGMATGAGGVSTGGSSAGVAGAAGGPAVCDADTSTCVQATPAGWQGPVVVLEVPEGEDNPGCTEDFPSEALVAYAGIQQPTNACDCECGDPQGATCEGGALSYQTGNLALCGISRDPPVAASFDSAGTCQSYTIPGSQQDDRRYFALSATASGDGSCASSLKTFDKPAPTWSTTAVLCTGPATVGDCRDGEVCIPEPSTTYDETACIYAQGDVECPASSLYVNKRLYHQGFDDDRACSCGACGAPSGTCDTSVQLLNVGCPSGISAVLPENVRTADCRDIDESTFETKAVRINREVGDRVTCAPPTADITGTTTPADPVTVCCLQ